MHGGAGGLGDIDDLVFLPEPGGFRPGRRSQDLKLETNKMVKAYKARGEMLAATDLRVGTTTSLVRALAETVGERCPTPEWLRR